MLVNRLIILGFALLTTLVWPQKLSRLDRGRAEDMLHVVGSEIRKHYYDPTLHEVDWDAAIAVAERKIREAKSFNMAMSHIAAMVDELGDSHTYFVPPLHSYRYDLGFHYQIIGQRCFVTRVHGSTDAYTKGVTSGDEILAIDGVVPDRNNLWKLNYVHTVLRPDTSLRLTLQGPPVSLPRDIEVAAIIEPLARTIDLTQPWGLLEWRQFVIAHETDDVVPQIVDYSESLMILKLPSFDSTQSEIGEIIKKARKHKALIIDLRGNPGGSVEILQLLVSNMFDHDVKIGDRVGRKEVSPLVAKGSSHPFMGQLVVLVDSESASAAELFARIVQIEKRGIVMGDQTSGAVMQARYYSERSGTETAIFYGVSITDADIIMSDGKSLERVGVTPDELLLPSAYALFHERDPVLARAAESVGVTIRPDEAGKLFP